MIRERYLSYIWVVAVVIFPALHYTYICERKRREKERKKQEERERRNEWSKGGRKKIRTKEGEIKEGMQKKKKEKREENLQN